MKKNNQKGFVLAEAFIVSTFVLGILVFMFLQIKTIINGYDRSFSYNTVPGIYHAVELKKFFKNNDDIIDSIGEGDFVVFYHDDVNYANIFDKVNVKTMVICNGDLSSLKTDETLSPKFQNYIKTLKNSNEYQFIVEYNDDTFATIKG